MTLRRIVTAILFLSAVACAQGTYSGPSTISGPSQWQWGTAGILTNENIYCPKAAPPNMTDQNSPTWGAMDDMANLPFQCMYTGLDATPSPGNIYVPATTATFANVLASANGGPVVNADGTLGGSGHFSCGDVVVLAAGVTYVGEYSLPAMACDGLHWITIKSTGVSNANFPPEGVRATPCIAGLVNDSNRRDLPGYPDYVCPGSPTPTVLAAKIMQGAGTTLAALSFASGANHYRLIGLELAKNPAFSIDKIVAMVPTGPSQLTTLGANHVIFDRIDMHGDQWTTASAPVNESQNGISAFNSQWIALINSWGYDTYCNSSCIDSHMYSGGVGFYQDGPHKLYDNLLWTAAEPFIFGGGGVGPGTPNTVNLEARANHLGKPLTWMLQINTCRYYYQAVTKNLSEFKNMTFALVEANYFENSWQGCQSDQTGYAMLLDPVSQNNHQSMTVTFDGSNVATTATSFTHHTGSSPLSGNPVDAANCPPGGCILNDAVSGVNYRFCNLANGCDQNGIPNLKCGTGVNAGLSCTTDGQCPGSYCAPTTSARLTSAVPAATHAANGCVPGGCPSCRNQDITFRFNEIYNVTHGLEVNAGLSSVCFDQAAGMARMSMHDNLMHGMSTEMSNGNDPYADSTGFIMSNGNLPPAVISQVGIRHNTIAEELGNPNNVSGLGNQVDHTDSQYMSGIAWTDNVSPGSLSISRTKGSNVTRGINGLKGLAYTYAVNACQRYFTTEVPDGTVGPASVPPPPTWPPQDFTFAGLPGGGTNYLVNYNGQYTAITSQTATGFHVTATVKVGDTINVRDLNDCNWTFAYNLLGVGSSGSSFPNGSPWIAPNFFGAGQDQAPYPSIVAGVPIRGTTLAPSSQSCGAANAQECILNETSSPGSFIGNFTLWLTGRNGDFSIAPGSPYFGTASDALSRPLTGRSPGADLTLLSARIAGVRTATFFPALTITTTTLSGGTHGVAYNTSLAASAGASQYWLGYKGWWVESLAANCGGNCGSLNNGAAHSGLVITRGGLVNGPIPILTISRTGCPATCISNYTINPTITGGTWEVGQSVTLAQFINGSPTPACNGANACTAADGSFAGTCTITTANPSTNTFSCALTGGVNVNILAHAPTGPIGTVNGCGVSTQSQCDSTASFAPVAAGTYTFWVGARDGAFQVARKQISVVIN